MRVIDYDSVGLVGRNLLISSDSPIEDLPPFVIPNDSRTFNRIIVPDEIEVSFLTNYVADAGIKDRPTFEPLADKASIASDGVEVLTITKLPRGTTSFELMGPVSDSWTETRFKTDLTINVPGHYKLKITQWPYQDREVEFDAA